MGYSCGKEIQYHTEKLCAENVGLVQQFVCGNESIDKYLRVNAVEDTSVVTYLYVEDETKKVLGFASICCSGIVCKYEKTCVMHPSIEIKYFAVSSEIQHLPFDDKPAKDRYCISDQFFCELLKRCCEISEEHIGASHITLYSVPSAHGFYKRNLMADYEKYMTKESYSFIDGCIPMFMPL